MNNFYIITFNNAYEATVAEESCKKDKITVNVVPTPTYITMSCGISLTADEDQIEKIKELISSKVFSCKKIYKIEGNKAIEVSI